MTLTNQEKRTYNQLTAHSSQPSCAQKIMPIAFYLPQYHAIPENDRAWGKGFTEWTNVKKALPLFEGHYQPRVPLNGNYYCLLDDGVMEAQAELAKQYGIYGFCYYHYWFKDGKKLLEQPLERMLHNAAIDIPFCLCWANENWTRRWDGGNDEIIVEQDYDDKENMERHIDYLCEFFSDPRYIRYEGKPLFIIYKPELIPDVQNRVEYFRDRIKARGFPGVFLAIQWPSFMYMTHEGEDFMNYGNDAYIQFEPLFCNSMNRRLKKPIKSLSVRSAIKKVLGAIGLLTPYRKIRDILHPQKLRIINYDKKWEQVLAYTPEDSRLMAGAFPGWDNTPRRKTGVAIHESTPEKFGQYMRRLVQKVRSEYAFPYVFINAWNEWGEGAYLEPDERYGYAYLEALKDALNY